VGVNASVMCYSQQDPRQGVDTNMKCPNQAD